jgi:hypothetical protein
MPIYGYKRAIVNKEFDLLDMREITFDRRPDDLRRVARFLEHYAAEIQSGGWRRSHISLTSFDRSWNATHADVDVIILNPDPEPPAVVH